MGTALLALTLMVGAPADAQDDRSGAEALEQLKRIVPEGRPTTFGSDEADTIYGQLAGLAVLATPAAELVGDSRLTGPCGGFAYSYDAHDFLVDAAADLGDRSPPIDLLDGGQAFTTDNPFRVDTRGVVLYYGFSPRAGEGPIDQQWTIRTSGGSVDSGGDSNPDGLNRNVGVIDVADQLPFDFSARVKIDGAMTSRNLPDCSAEGYVELIGGGLISPIGIAALTVFALGLVGLVVHARPTRRAST